MGNITPLGFPSGWIEKSNHFGRFGTFIGSAGTGLDGTGPGGMEGTGLEGTVGTGPGGMEGIGSEGMEGGTVGTGPEEIPASANVSVVSPKSIEPINIITKITKTIDTTFTINVLFIILFINIKTGAVILQMRFLYGNPNIMSDVTEFITQHIFLNGKFIIPPKMMQRNKLFERNPIEDNVFLIDFEQENQIIELQKDRELLLDKNAANELRICSLDTKLQEMHYNMFFKHGYINDEIPEQKMALRFIKPTDTVLEIGGNVGRNSLIVASLLQNQDNMVVLECDPQIAKQLQDNRDANNMKFHIEASALSARRLWQKGWDTKVSDEPVDDHKEVQIISLQQLQDKYKKTFNTLVLDCEGAFYYILQDFPDILKGVTKILMENDYHVLEQKTFVDQTLSNNGFQVAYQEAGGWGPCQPRFFETWMKA